MPLKAYFPKGMRLNRRTHLGEPLSLVMLRALVFG